MSEKMLLAGLRFSAKVRLFRQTGDTCAIHVARWLRKLRKSRLTQQPADFFHNLQLDPSPYQQKRFLDTADHPDVEGFSLNSIAAQHQEKIQPLLGKLAVNVQPYLESKDRKDKMKSRRTTLSSAKGTPQDKRIWLIEGGPKYMENPTDQAARAGRILEHSGKGPKISCYNPYDVEDEWSPSQACRETEVRVDWRPKFLRYLYDGDAYKSSESYFHAAVDKGTSGHSIGMCTMDSMFYLFDPLYGEMCLPLEPGAGKPLHLWLTHKDVLAYFSECGYVTIDRFIPRLVDAKEVAEGEG
jgi:hypothetical protein